MWFYVSKQTPLVSSESLRAVSPFSRHRNRGTCLGSQSSSAVIGGTGPRYRKPGLCSRAGVKESSGLGGRC